VKYERLLRIWESDFGRSSGWLVEHDGKTAAILSEPGWEEMFWVSYKIEICTDDPELRRKMETADFWVNLPLNYFVWRSREFGDTVEGVWAAGAPFPEPGRLTLRRLYLPAREPRLWDQIILWARRRLRARREQRANAARVPPAS